MRDLSLLDKIIVGRVEPHIYAFTTNTIPNYIKVGDTYRPVSIRLDEWKKYYPELEKNMILKLWYQMIYFLEIIQYINF